MYPETESIDIHVDKLLCRNYFQYTLRHFVSININPLHLVSYKS